MWIEVHDNLPDHPKVLAAALALNMDKDAMVGKLCRLWTWAITNRESGYISDSEIRAIAEVMRCPRRPVRLFEALSAPPPGYSAGLLDRVEGGYMIHDWDQHTLALSERRERKRAGNRERARRMRERNHKSRAGGESMSSPPPGPANPQITGADSEYFALFSGNLLAACQAVDPAGGAAIHAWLLSADCPGTEDMIACAVEYATRRHDENNLRQPLSYIKSLIFDWRRRGLRTREEIMGGER